MVSGKIDKEMTVLDIVSRYRETEAVFKAYDAQAGECICCHSLFDSLDDISLRYRLDLDRLISDLEAATASARNASAAG